MGNSKQWPGVSNLIDGRERRAINRGKESGSGGGWLAWSGAGDDGSTLSIWLMTL